MPDALYRLLLSSHTQDVEQINDKIAILEFSPAPAEQRLREMEILDTSFLDAYFETNDVLALPHAASLVSVDANLDVDSSAKSWMIKGDKLQAIDDMAV